MKLSSISTSVPHSTGMPRHTGRCVRVHTHTMPGFNFMRVIETSVNSTSTNSLNKKNKAFFSKNEGNFSENHSVHKTKFSNSKF